MSTKVYCEDCARKVKPEPIHINHILYLLITLISFGIGFILWGIAAMSTNDRYRCPLCKDDLTKLFEQAKAKEDSNRKQKDKEFIEEHGLPWKMRIPVVLVHSAIFFGLYTLDTPESPISWVVYFPFVIGAFAAITGHGLFLERDIIE